MARQSAMRWECRVPKPVSEKGQSLGLTSGGCGHDSCVHLSVLSPAYVLLVMSEISILLATVSHFLSVLPQIMRTVCPFG